MSNTTIFLLLCSIVLLHGAFAASKPPQDPKCASLLPAYLADLDAGRVPKPLPIPIGVRPPVVRDVGYNLDEVRAGVYTVHDGVYYSMIVLRGRHLVLIDFPDSLVGADAPTTNLTLTAKAALEILDGLKPSKVDMVYSHSHFDHIGTASLTKTILQSRFPNAKFKIWASKGTLRSLQEAKSDRAPLPDLVFSKKRFLNVGHRTGSIRIRLEVIGGHTEDDIVVYFKPNRRQKGVAFAVDLIFPGWAPAFYFALTQNMNQYIAVHDKLARLDFDTYIGGHLTKTGGKKDIEINKMYTLSVIEALGKAQSESSSFAEVAKDLGFFDPNSNAFGNLPFAVGEFFGKLEKACARTVIEEWGCRIGGVASVAQSNCVTARFFRTLDS